MRTSERGAKVSVVSRVLATLLAAASGFAFVLFLLDLAHQESVMGNGDALNVILLAVGSPILFAASVFVATTGRSPRWMTRLEEAHDQRFGSHLDARQSVERLRRLSQLGAVVSSGILLTVLGFAFHLFSGETPWVGIGIISVAWVVIATLLWRYLGSRFRDDSSGR